MKKELCEFCGKGRNDFENDQKFYSQTCRNKNEALCKECNKSFGSSLILRIHIESVHKGIRYNCLVCNQWFSSLASMKRHGKNHIQSTKWTCIDTAKPLQTNAFSVKIKE